MTPARAAVDRRDQSRRFNSRITHTPFSACRRDSASGRTAGNRALAPDRRRTGGSTQPAAQLEAARARPSSQVSASRAEDGDGPSRMPAWPRPCGRRNGDRTPACRTRRAPRRADEPRATHRCEDRGTRTHDDAGFPGGDPLALVAARGLRQPRVEQRDPRAEAGPEATHRLRGECDLGHQDDRAEATLECGGAGLEVDLGLTAAGRAVEQVSAAAAVHRPDDRGHRRRLLRRQLGGRGLADQSRRRLSGLAAPGACAARRGSSAQAGSSRSTGRPQRSSTSAGAAARRGRRRWAPPRRFAGGAPRWNGAPADARPAERDRATAPQPTSSGTS